MLKDKLAKLGGVIKANKDAIIQKGLVVAGVIVATVLIAVINANQENDEEMVELVEETDLSEQPATPVEA